MKDVSAMEARFQALSKHDRESYRNMISVDYILHQKAPIALLYGMAVIVAAVIWWGGLQSGRAAQPWVVVVTGLLSLAICVLCVPYLDHFTVKIVCARVLKSTLKNARDLNTEAQLSFRDDGFTIAIPGGQAERAYSCLTELAETNDYLLLLHGKEFSYTMAKTSFTLGTAEAFKAFITEKTGKTFRVLEL